MLVEVVNQPIHLLKIKSCICIGEITAPWYEQMLSLELICEVVQIFSELFRFYIGTKGVPRFVGDKWLVVEHILIVPKAIGPAVVVPHRTCKDLLLISKVLCERSPQEVHCLIIQPLVLVGVVETGEEPGLQAHVSEEACVGIRMTKRINMPSNSRLNAKLFQKPLMAMHHVVNHIFIMWACFIVHAPASVDKLKTAFINKLPSLISHIPCLIVVPHGEELHLHLGESSIGIQNEILHHSADGHAH